MSFLLPQLVIVNNIDVSAEWCYKMTYRGAAKRGAAKLHDLLAFRDARAATHFDFVSIKRLITETVRSEIASNLDTVGASRTPSHARQFSNSERKIYDHLQDASFAVFVRNSCKILSGSSLV